MMKKSYLILIFISSILSFTCKENSTSIITNDSFSFTLSVKDAAGNPVPGLQVSAWNRLSSNTGIPSNLPGKESFSTHATTIISFDAPIGAHVKIETSTLDGTPLDTLADGWFEAGYELVSWQNQLHSGTAVLKCRLTVTDTATGNVIFRDSIYSVQWQPDPAISALGWTSAAGTFQTTDKSAFAHLSPLPTLIYTNANGPDSLGTFTILDTVAITLSDTLHIKKEEFRRVVRQGDNLFNLVWNPTAASQPALPTEEPRAGHAMTSRVTRANDIPTHWKLHQNYPNPFN